MIEQRFSVGAAGGRARLLYQGRPIHLSGPASHCILEGYPDVPAANRVTWNEGFNYVRYWCFDYGMEKYARNPDNLLLARKAARLRAYPYLPIQNGEQVKWDLTQINPAYRTWLQGQLATARANGVVILISLFSNHDFRVGVNYGWEECPWNPVNNINNAANGKTLLFSPTPAVKATDYWKQFVREPKPGSTTLAQDEARQHAIMQYVNDMVSLTSGYWNVFFEICNEPQSLNLALEDYLPFCDLVAKQIHLASEGKRMILYNCKEDASDYIYWTQSTRLKSWIRVNGIIVHGVNPGTFNPETISVKNRVFIQLSSDAYAEPPGDNDYRDMQSYNQQWADHLAPRDVDFEAYTTNGPAARGVLLAAPANRPTKLI